LILGNKHSEDSRCLVYAARASMQIRYVNRRQFPRSLTGDRGEFLVRTKR